MTHSFYKAQSKIFVFFLFLTTFLCISFLLLILGNKLYQRTHESIQEEIDPLPVVIIDAGHGGEDGGAVGINGIYEKDINLSIAKKLELLLRSAGIQTVMTRSDDRLLYDPNSDYEGHKKALDMQARLNLCRQYENAVFISIHQNTFGQEQYSGLQVYYSNNHEGSFSLAQTIQSLSATSLCPGNNRKVKNAGSDIFLLEHITHPSVLVECGFLSNRKECEALSTEEYQKQMATLLCVSVLNFFHQNNTFENTST